MVQKVKLETLVRRGLLDQLAHLDPLEHQELRVLLVCRGLWVPKEDRESKVRRVSMDLQDRTEEMVYQVLSAQLGPRARLGPLGCLVQRGHRGRLVPMGSKDTWGPLVFQVLQVHLEILESRGSLV